MEFKITKEEILKKSRENYTYRNVLEDVFPEAFKESEEDSSEPIYKCGDIFSYGSGKLELEYILSFCCHENNMCRISLINIKTGICWNDGGLVKSFNHVTHSEFKDFFCTIHKNKFKKIN